jgi:signal transduction histidine kinase
VVVDDARAGGRVAACGLDPAHGWPRLASVVLLPMRSSGSVTGVLALGWRVVSEQLYRDTDLLLPMAFTQQVTLALQVAQAQDDQGRLAVFEDRDRIARDLHDLVIQRLFAIGLNLQNATRLADRPDVLADRVSAAVTDIDATISDIRRSIFELSSPTTESSLRVELGAAIAVAASALGFTPRLQTQGPVDTLVPDAVRTHLMAVLREALSNVARHASARSAQVGLDVRDGLLLTVTDDGVGPSEGVRESGLRNMRDRATGLGGTLDVGRGRGGGTVVHWRVPLA